MTRGPTMHTVGSRAGRHKPRALGMADKGRQRDSSMGRAHKQARWKGVR